MSPDQPIRQRNNAEQQHENGERKHEGADITRKGGHLPGSLAVPPVKNPEVDPDALLRLLEMQIAQVRSDRPRAGRTPGSRIAGIVFLLILLIGTLIALEFLVAKLPRPAEQGIEVAR
jgi:hypothetical protein